MNEEKPELLTFEQFQEEFFNELKYHVKGFYERYQEYYERETADGYDASIDFFTCLVLDGIQV